MKAHDQAAILLRLEDLPIPHPRAWAFRHSLVEMCTAVKGIGALEIVRFAPPRVSADAPAWPHIRLDRALEFLIGDRLA